jgi:hypothetical protein
MIRRIVAALVVGVTFGIVTGATPAQAIGGRPGYFSGWDGALYTNTVIVEINPDALDNGDCLDLTPSLDNRISAIMNSSNTTDFIVYAGDACAPGITSTVWHNSAGNMNSTWNNNIESVRRSWAN